MNELVYNPQLIKESQLLPRETQTRLMANADPILGYIARGAIASLQDDIEQIHTQFQMALQASGRLCWIVQLYATALKNICLLYEANNLLLEYHTRYPYELSLLRDTIESCVNTGKVLSGEKLIKQWHQLTDKPNPYETLIKQSANLYRRQSLTESEVQPLLETALSLVRQSLRNQHKNFGISVDYANYDGGPYLSYTIKMDLPVDELLELEEQHNQLLLDQTFKDHLLDDIIITFEHLTPKNGGNQ
jgi:hypothetical protein